MKKLIVVIALVLMSTVAFAEEIEFIGEPWEGVWDGRQNRYEMQGCPVQKISVDGKIFIVEIGCPSKGGSGLIKVRDEAGNDITGAIRPYQISWGEAVYNKVCGIKPAEPKGPDPRTEEICKAFKPKVAQMEKEIKAMYKGIQVTCGCPKKDAWQTPVACVIQCPSTSMRMSHDYQVIARDIAVYFARKKDFNYEIAAVRSADDIPIARIWYWVDYDYIQEFYPW
jgi:hypothetical protein